MSITVDHAVGALDVGLATVAPATFTVFPDGDGGLGALHGLGGGQLDHVRGHDLAGDHVVGEDALELLQGLGLEEVVAGGRGWSLAKAASVGAKTVQAGPFRSASTRPAALTAATRVLREPAATAVSTMLALAAAPAAAPAPELVAQPAAPMPSRAQSARVFAESDATICTCSWWVDFLNPHPMLQGRHLRRAAAAPAAAGGAGPFPPWPRRPIISSPCATSPSPPSPPSAPPSACIFLLLLNS